MRHHISLLFSTFFIVLVACNTKLERSDKENFQNLTSDSFLLKRLATETKALNLKDVTKGVDSFELRIWHGTTIATPKQLVILKYEDSTWIVTSTDYWFNYQWKNGRPEKAFVDSAFTYALKPAINIPQLVDSILRFRLDSFPSQGDIPNFQHRVADGVFYYIELATPRYYKAVAYYNPDKYDDSYNRQITKLINLLRRIGVYSMP